MELTNNKNNKLYLLCISVLLFTFAFTSELKAKENITPYSSSPITFDITVESDVSQNNDIKYMIENVVINVSSAGYSAVTITVPDELVAHYTLPESWTEFVSGNTINFIISNPVVAGSDVNITDFLENNFYLTLANENVFANQSSHVSINISENLLSSRVDENGVIHYYEFVPAYGINWLDAYNQAKSRTVNGLSGYLATITSQEEQDFIYNSIAKSPGWLGATRMRYSDGTRINDEGLLSNSIVDYNYNATVANDWYWATGPEASTVFFNGTTYLNGTTLANHYSFFAGKPGRQPDNFQNNEFVMMFAFENTPYWNDTTLNMRGIGEGYYVEYGGYPNELPAQDSAGFQVSIPAPVKVEYLDLMDNSIYTTEYLFGNLNDVFSVDAVPSAPSGYSYLGLDSNSAEMTGVFKDAMIVITHRYAPLFNANFHLNYTTNETPPSTQIIAQTQLLDNVKDPLREGYNFRSWNTATDGSDKTWVFDIDAMPASDLDLYAQWDIIQYQLSFDLNGSEGTAPDNQIIDFEALATQPVTPEREGHSFSGWNTAIDGSGSTWDFNSSSMPAGDVTLYAQWDVTQYQLRFDLNGSEATAPENQVIDFEALATQPVTPEREGHSFNGWNTAIDGSGTTWDFNSSTMPASDMTLYAQWSIMQYQLHFDLNGSIDNTPDSQLVDFQALTTEPVNPIHEGHAFKEWNTSIDGSGTTWDFLSSTMPASDVTLYAQWQKDEHILLTPELDPMLPNTGNDSNIVLSSTVLITVGGILIIFQRKIILASNGIKEKGDN